MAVLFAMRLLEACACRLRLQGYTSTPGTEPLLLSECLSWALRLDALGEAKLLALSLTSDIVYSIGGEIQEVLFDCWIFPNEQRI